MASATLSEPVAAQTLGDVAAEYTVVSDQDCCRSPYTPEGYGECGSTWNTSSPEFRGPSTDFPLPALNEEYVITASADWTPCSPSEYPYVPSGCACSPAVQPPVSSSATASETAQQPLDAKASSGVAPVHCFPPTQHGPILPHSGFSGTGSGASEEVPPPHTWADVIHMETTVPLEMTCPPLMTASAAQSDYVSAAEMNGYPSLVYILPSYSGFLPNGASDALPRPRSQSPEPCVSFDSPMYRLTPKKAFPLVYWYWKHKDHPYPSRVEKLHLCRATQLSYTQVTTWFANARRRQKKKELKQGGASSDKDEM